MRERLTAAFVLLTLTLLVGAGVVHGYTQEGIWRERESTQLSRETSTLAALLAQRLDAGKKVNADYLSGFVEDDSQIELVLPNGRRVAATGSSYDADDDRLVSSSMPVGDGAVTLHRVGSRSASIWDSTWTRVILLGMCALIAGVFGYLVARTLSQPFRQLAVAAAALGRGRFDLDLPTTSNPEARAIGRALEISAEQLRDRMEREQQFAVHASHVLRTPLTSLRLQLDELLADDDLPGDAREAVTRGLLAVEALEAAAGELVELSRTSALVAGAEIPLRDLATTSAQRWADALDAHGGTFTAAVEGDIELLYTPGPIETVLDLLLDGVLRDGGGGAVRLVLEGDAAMLRVHLQCEHPKGERGDADLLNGRVRSVVEALGGRLEGRDGGDTLSVLLPRR